MKMESKVNWMLRLLLCAFNVPVTLMIYTDPSLDWLAGVMEEANISVLLQMALGSKTSGSNKVKPSSHRFRTHAQGWRGLKHIALLLAALHKHVCLVVHTHTPQTNVLKICACL